jgi:uncharacterized protein
MFYEAIIEGISVDKNSNVPVVFLNTGEYYLNILVGVNEAFSISRGLKDKKIERPLTHDLIVSMLKVFGYSVEGIFIHRIENNIFFAKLRCLEKNNKEGHKNIVEIDCRPSDGFAIVSRLKSKIFIEESVLEVAGIKK